MSKLRDSQKAELFSKISDFIAQKIVWKVQSERPKWTKAEIAQHFGLPQNRQSELIGRLDGKYLDKRLSENHLVMLLGGKFMTIDELLKSARLTEDEKEYLQETYWMFQNDRLREAVMKTQEAGGDPADILFNNLPKAKE